MTACYKMQELQKKYQDARERIEAASEKKLDKLDSAIADQEAEHQKTCMRCRMAAKK